jgi:hypothetical protein
MVYDAAQWHDFFVMVGGGAAALTGLVFVAMSLNADAITQDAAHRYRAIGTLTGFASAFVVSALALMGSQDYRAIGAEWLVVSAVAGAVYIAGYLQAIRRGGSEAAIRIGRVVFGTLMRPRRDRRFDRVDRWPRGACTWPRQPWSCMSPT